MEARNNATMLESVLAGIDAQIADLERLILEKERWEIREEKREDTLAEEGRAGQGRAPSPTAPVIRCWQARTRLLRAAWS